MDRTVKKFKKLLLLCLLLAPLTVCAADGNRALVAPYTVDSTAEDQSKVMPLDHFDSPRVMTFLSDQSLLVKGGALGLLELVWQLTGQGDAAAETVPSEFRQTPVTDLPGVYVAKLEYYGHRSPLGTKKRVSQTLH